MPSRSQIAYLLIILDVKDPTPLRAFATDLRATHHARSQPSMKQQSALSSAQQLVRTARRTIIEPVLASFELSSDSSDEEQQPSLAERDQIRSIHLRKSRLTVRASGVHILRNMQDESQDVDIATDGEPLAPKHSSVITSPLAPHCPTEPAVISNSRMRSPRLSRPRRPLPTRPHATKAKQRALETRRLSEPESVTPELPTAKKEKPRSETYKQAWSVSEQHLLERLLAEIPDGEKNRYAASLRLCHTVTDGYNSYKDGPKYQRRWAVAVLHVRLPVAYKSILKN